nr:hypothetical protein [Saprospiraceae bacterium]
MNRYVLLMLFFTALVYSCANSPGFPDKPDIEFVEMENNTVAQSSQMDSVVFVIYFEDGDGNLRPVDQEANVFLMDLRDSTIAFAFASPDIPTEGSGNGIKGTMRLHANILRGDICCIYESGQPPCTPAIPIRTDSLYYDLYLFDEDGKRSNTVKAGPIVLICD